MNKPLLKWSPAQPIRIPDNIISSGAREKKQLGFTPKYENESAQHMHFLMSNEYMRMWFKERAQYEKDVYTREQIIREESKIKRRMCQRMMTYRRPGKNQFIEDMVQKTKEKDLSQEENYNRLKYKPACQKKRGDQKSQNLKGSKSPKDSKGAKDLQKDSKEEGDIEDVVICTTTTDNDCEEDK